MIFGSWFKRTAPRVLIVDPSLRRRAGHPFHAARSVARAAADAGLETLVLGSRAADAATRSGLPFRQCFSRSLYARADWSMAGYEAEAALLAAKMLRGIGRARSVRAIVMPTCEQAQLRAVASLIERGILPKTVAILGWLLLPPRWNADPAAGGAEAQLGEYRDALAKIEKARGGAGVTWLCCETADLSALYAALPCAEIHIAPSPSPFDEAAATGPDRASPERPHFVVAGHVTRSKGYELLPDALRAVLAADDRPSFTIHGVVDRAVNPGAQEILQALSRLGPRVRVLTQDLASADYYALIRSADMVLLPYRLPDYRDRGSGIFNEAVRYGIPVVAPAGSAFAREAIRDRRAVPLREHSSAALAEAIGEAVRDLPLLGANCQAYRPGDDGFPPAPVLESFLRLVASEAESVSGPPA